MGPSFGILQEEKDASFVYDFLSRSPWFLCLSAAAAPEDRAASNSGASFLGDLYSSSDSRSLDVMWIFPS